MPRDRAPSLRRICVFLGSSSGGRPEYAKAAREFARALVARDFGLVYGGASIGLMGILADTVLEAGGQVVGVIPESLDEKEVSHHGLSELRIVTSMHERKTVMSELSDAVIAMPGGLGTLEEFFEMLTWAQLGFHSKPCGLLNPGGYFDRLLEFLDHAVSERFLKPQHRELIISERDPGTLLDRLVSHRARPTEKWIDREPD